MNLRKEVLSKRPTCLFNASVVLSGLRSPNGGSAKVLDFARGGKILGVISEIGFDEIIRHVDRLSLDRGRVINKCKDIFGNIVFSPSGSLVEKYDKVVIDKGDAHVLASALECGVDYLVTLDKRHLLVLKDQIGEFKIVTPGELIAILNGE